MKISVIIPTLNEEKHIGKLLDSVNTARYAKKEIIIVDGGSTDRTVEIAKSKRVRVVKETGKVRCPANAKNIGAKVAKGEVLLYLDADTHSISNNFIEDAMKEFRKKDVIGVVPDNRRHLKTFWHKALFHSRTLVVWSRNLIVRRKIGLKLNEISWFPNFVRKRVFWEMVGYNLDGVEDQGFLRRYKEYDKNRKKETVYKKTCALYSQDPETLPEILKQTKWYARVLIPSNKKAGPKYIFTFLLSLLQPLFFVSIFLMPLHPVFILLALPYIIKLVFMLLYLLFFKGATYNSKHYVLGTILLDMISWPWKILGILEYILNIGSKNTVFSRRK